MIKETIIIDAETGEAQKGIDNLTKSVDKLGDKVDKIGEDSSENLGSIKKSSSESAKGVSSLTAAFRGVGIAIKAAGIGIIVGLLTTLKEVFESNQKVADLFAVTFETISIVFNDIVNSTIEVYEAITESTGRFESLKKVVNGLIDIALAPLKATFFTIKLALQEAQLAWQKSFFGDKDPTKIKELNESIKETKESLSGISTSVILAVTDIAENAAGAAKEIGGITSEVIETLGKVSVSAAIESAKTNVQLTKSSEKAQAEQTKLIETYDRQAEKQRQIRDNDLLTIDERVKANEKLGEVLDKQEEAMIKQADAILAAAQAQFEKNGNDENQIALIEAQTNRLGVLAQIEGFRSEQKSNEVALQKESLELTNSQIQAEGERNVSQLEANAELLTNEYAKLLALREAADIEKAIQEDILKSKRDSYKEGTQAYQDANNELLAFQQEATNKQKELDREITQSKMDAFETAANLVGAETGLGRALLVAKQLMAARELAIEVGRTITFSTQAAARSAVAVAEGTAQTAKIGFPQNIPMLIGYAAQAVGIIGAIRSATKKAKAPIKTPSPSSITASVQSAAPTAPQAPSFNIVGSSETNQLAEAIGSQSQQPIKAYVVSNDVTTAQSLDRNIVESASL